MFTIKILNENKTIGFYCGIFSKEGTKICGYEEVIKSNVKKYKTKANAEKQIVKLHQIYGDETYKFEIVEVE